MSPPVVPSQPERWAPLLASTDPTTHWLGEMLRDGRHALLLRPEVASSLSTDQIAIVRDVLLERMSLAPAAVVALRSRRAEAEGETGPDGERLFSVDALFVDRMATSNADFQRFVAAGGYADQELWDEPARATRKEWVDSTGRPGPRWWRDGAPPGDRLDHPVVGVNWFEAAAYARWSGKRLPGDAEWVRVAAWPVSAGAGRPVQRRFPWGDTMDRSLANLWEGRRDATVPVAAHPEGTNPGGVRQLIGNVWEWTADDFGGLDSSADRLESETPLKSLRGGAFDTYFDSHATCQYQSGENPLARKPNVGFRCVAAFEALIPTGLAATDADDQP